jgi:hypothetical protein
MIAGWRPAGEKRSDPTLSATRQLKPDYRLASTACPWCVDHVLTSVLSIYFRGGRHFAERAWANREHRTFRDGLLTRNCEEEPPHGHTLRDYDPKCLARCSIRCTDVTAPPNRSRRASRWIGFLASLRHPLQEHQRTIGRLRKLEGL